MNPINKIISLKNRARYKLGTLKNDLLFFRKVYINKQDDYPLPEISIKAKPEILNLNIIDNCNSKCTMCNIWKRDVELEITPDQLKEILSDELFSNLKYVGVTGGEPTLREDLPEIYRKIIEAVPGIKGLSIITNAIIEEDVKKRILDVKNICEKHGVDFHAMVSIDGVGKAHDDVRGTKGNFETAISVYNYLQNELKIPTTFGATISKLNVWDADDLLYYVKKHDMVGRFRIAETINRLYNHNRGKVIRNFDEDESYNLLLLFEKLKLTYETNPTYKRTYSSIQNILQGGDRLIGCPYHNRGIVLGAKGQISYCAPKSKDLGNTLELSAQEIFTTQFEEKERIIREDCSNCIHDYHAPITKREVAIKEQEVQFAKYLKIENADKIANISRFVKKIPKNGNKKRVFIFGWYGTETVGDKAILAGIVNYYKDEFKDNVEFVIGSLHPFISDRTCYELGIDAKVVSTRTFDLLSYSKSSDIVVMGGGPLMDLNVLYVPLLGFKVAKAYNNKTVVFGCGIGPLKYKKFEEAVKDILSISDEILLRDKGSINILKSYNLNKEAKLFGDPAKKYIQLIDKSINTKKENVICCYLRDWTFEYYIGSKEDFIKDKEKFEEGIAKLIKQKAKELEVDRIELHHMHNFVIGNDDRDFSRYFIDKYFANDDRITFNKKLSTVDNIVESMKKSKLNICMRFHSVLFAHTLGTNFLAIDYTLGGKIDNYLKDNSSLEKKITAEMLIKNI